MQYVLTQESNLMSYLKKKKKGKPMQGLYVIVLKTRRQEPLATNYLFFPATYVFWSKPCWLPQTLPPP